MAALQASSASDSARRMAQIPGVVRRVHLIGVGGTAMAAVAGLLVESGYEVSGSDQELYEPTRSLLMSSRVRIVTGFSANNLIPPPDLVIVGNVITRTNPEAQALLESGLAYLSMPEAIWHFCLRRRRILMVAGTHGKTTSTSLMAHVLNSAGRAPGLLVGGLARNFGSNYRLGSGPEFVIEGDEYDSAFFDKGPKFLHYRPQAAILTAVEFDHADIYRDLEHVKSSFRTLLEGMDSSQTVALCADFPNVLEVAANTRAKTTTFGLKAGSVRAVDIRTAGDGSRFSIVRDGATIAADLRIALGGRMNVANALGVYLVLREALDLPHELIARGLETFAGVARRQEVVGQAAGITVIDDFAHHPTAIEATLEALADRFPGRRILAAFEPRSNTSRRNVFQAQFGRAFDRATRVYLAPVYFKENDAIAPEQRLDIEALSRQIAVRGSHAVACGSNEELLEAMLRDAVPGDLVVFMSNGPFANLKDRFLAALEARA